MKLLIFGVGETARLACEYFTHDSPMEVAAFTVDDALVGSAAEFCGRPIIPLSQAAKRCAPTEHRGFVAMGSSRMNHDRAEACGKMKALGYSLASYVSSRAFVWRDVRIGENCFVLENNVLQSGVVIGDNSTLWSGNHIGHLTSIGNHTFITSHVVLSGSCEVGDHSFLGVNCSVADHVKIAAHNFIGMGSCISQSTLEDSVYTGNPAERSKVSARKFCKV